MNRRGFLAGIGAAIGAFAVTTRLATAEIRVAESCDYARDTVTLDVYGFDHYGDRVWESVTITAEQLEDSGGEIELMRFKTIDTVCIDEKRSARVQYPGRFVMGMKPSKVYWSSRLDPMKW